MFLSIIIPVYNTEKYLAECLDSCLQQDIPYDDYEIICINDGSTDGCLEILKRYESQYSNVMIIDQENAGVSAARNAGLDIARGEYVWFVDSDDIIRINSLHYLKNISLECMSDIISFQLYLFNDELNKTERDLLDAHQLKSNSTLCAQPSMLIRRSRTKNVRWHEGIEMGEDSLFLRELYLMPQTETKVNDVFYLYRQHSQSAVHSSQRITSSKRLFSHVRGAIIMRDIYNSPNGACEANANYLMMFLVYSMVAIARNNNEDSKKALTQLKQEQLFPFVRPPECTKSDAFVTTRKDLLGRAFNYICLYSHTRIGFLLLKLWYRCFARNNY